MNPETLCYMKKARCKKSNVVQLYLYEVPRVGKFIETESIIEVI